MLPVTSVAQVPALAKAVGTTFGTYMMADFLSNFIQHPTQQMDYGALNKFIGREVDSTFWGTRLQHIGEYAYDVYNRLKHSLQILVSHKMVISSSSLLLTSNASNRLQSISISSQLE